MNKGTGFGDCLSCADGYENHEDYCTNGQYCLKRGEYKEKVASYDNIKKLASDNAYGTTKAQEQDKINGANVVTTKPYYNDYDPNKITWEQTTPAPIKSDGGDTKYYELPPDAKEIQDLIEYKNMSFSIGNIFKACYRIGEKEGNDEAYDIRKILWYAERELKRVLKKKNP